MVNFRTSAFKNSAEYSLKLEEFEPKEGYESFLKQLCANIGETYLDWYQGIESGIGHITYKGYTLTVYWSDFPFALSFDCRDEAMALDLRKKLESYLIR